MKKGFTLIELIVVIFLFSTLTAVVSWVFVVGIGTWGSGKNRADIRQEASLSTERMMREISQASEITRAKSDEIKFEADLDQDDSVESITFKVSNDDNLERTETITGPDPDIVVIMARNIQSFTLGYYLDEDNSNLLSSVTGPDLDDIRVVIISLTLSKGDETVTLSTSAYTRNQGLDDE